MNLDAETARFIADLQQMGTLGWCTAIGLALLFWWVDNLREKGCDRCAHCQARNRAAKAEAEERERLARERLFGRQITPPPKKESPRDEKRDEGRKDS